MSQKFSNCFVFPFVLDQNAGTGQPAPRQHDVQLHQHLPDRGHQRAVESECCISLYSQVKVFLTIKVTVRSGLALHVISLQINLVQSIHSLAQSLKATFLCPQGKQAPILLHTVSVLRSDSFSPSFTSSGCHPHSTASSYCCRSGTSCL